MLVVSRNENLSNAFLSSSLRVNVVIRYLNECLHISWILLWMTSSSFYYDCSLFISLNFLNLFLSMPSYNTIWNATLHALYLKSEWPRMDESATGSARNRRRHKNFGHLPRQILSSTEFSFPRDLREKGRERQRENRNGYIRRKTSVSFVSVSVASSGCGSTRSKSMN